MADIAEADDRAEVIAVEPCPTVQNGPGRVVLTTVNHLSNFLFELVVRDHDRATADIKVTGWHKLYREPDGWVPAYQLRSGDVLRGREGPVTVISVSRIPGVFRVYNMTVEDEHVYYVSDLDVLAHNTCAGRSGKQARLRALGDDPNVSSADRGWIQQDQNAIDRGKRTTIRVPPGKNLAHRRGFEAKNGYGYDHSDLQDTDLHKLQHKHEGY